VPAGCPQLGRGQPLEIGAGGRVDSQGLAARPGQLQIGIRLVKVGQVQLASAVGFGADHLIQAGVLAGPGQLHIQPVDVFAAGQADQGAAAGQPQGASLMVFGLAGRVDGPLDQPRCPLPTVRSQPVQLGVDPISALGELRTSPSGTPTSSRLPWRSAAVHSTPSVRTSSRW
jgi:hypothetical protein